MIEKKQPAAMENRAYSTLEVKELDDGKRRFSGIATTPSVDRVGDIIDPMGVKFAAELPLLWQHKHDQPIGWVKFGKPTAAGIPFEAEVAQTDVPGTLKDMLDHAWEAIKLGLVRAVSIGFRALEWAFLDNGGIRYDATEVYELSAVTIPANADAIISTVKSVDAALRKEAGVPEPEIPQPDEPAAPGKGRVVKLEPAARDRAQPFVIRNIKRLTA
jgi:HK97 family phage prohead protease